MPLTHFIMVIFRRNLSICVEIGNVTKIISWLRCIFDNFKDIRHDNEW